jgi:sorbitol-specific phosphotransferase system component IIBC
MIFTNREKNPQAMLMVGMASLAIALIWPRFLPVTGGLGPAAIDGLRGVLIGVSIGLNLWAARLGGVKRRGNR